MVNVGLIYAEIQFQKHCLRIGCRAALVMLVLICRAVYIFVEQPATSRLFISPYYVFIQEVCQRLSIKFYNSFLSETKICVFGWTTIYPFFS